MNRILSFEKQIKSQIDLQSWKKLDFVRFFCKHSSVQFFQTGLVKLHLHRFWTQKSSSKNNSNTIAQWTHLINMSCSFSRFLFYKSSLYRFRWVTLLWRFMVNMRACLECLCCCISQFIKFNVVLQSYRFERFQYLCTEKHFKYVSYHYSFNIMLIPITVDWWCFRVSIPWAQYKRELYAIWIIHRPKNPCEEFNSKWWQNVTDRNLCLISLLSI